MGTKPRNEWLPLAIATFGYLNFIASLLLFIYGGWPGEASFALAIAGILIMIFSMLAKFMPTP